MILVLKKTNNDFYGTEQSTAKKKLKQGNIKEEVLELGLADAKQGGGSKVLEWGLPVSAGKGQICLCENTFQTQDENI